jgi:hypothetical protein
MGGMATTLETRETTSAADQSRLIPASATIPTAATKQQDDENNDEKRGGIHL